MKADFQWKRAEDFSVDLHWDTPISVNSDLRERLDMNGWIMVDDSEGQSRELTHAIEWPAISNAKQMKARVMEIGVRREH